MSVYHVLPSNTSPETFPKNHASFYSTPLNNPLILDGEWEVACLSICHNNCINSLNNDTLHIIDQKGDLTHIRKPTCMAMTFAADKKVTFEDLLTSMNKALKGIVTFRKRADNYFLYDFQSKKFIVHLSTGLAHVLKLTNALTDYDHFKGNVEAVEVHKLKSDDCFITIIPKSTPHTTVRLKNQKEEMEIGDLLQNFKLRVTDAGYPHIKLSLNEVNGKHLILSKWNDSPEIILFSSKLHFRTGFRQNGIDPIARNNRHYGYHWEDILDEEWDFMIYPLNDVDKYALPLRHRIDFKPRMFTDVAQMCKFITQEINHPDVQVTATSEFARLHLKSKDIGIELSPNMRDILGFNLLIFQNGPLMTLGNSKVSLTRRINYFYVYSNIGELVRIGDTEGPLLCHFPFNPQSCSVITERFFKKPTYVKVLKNHMSQIDIGLYDDAGELIPFHQDALTTLRLHFRRALS